MPSGTWATSLFSTHSNTDHVRKALTHVKICLSTDNSERRFNNSTEKLKSGIKLNNWTELNWTELKCRATLFNAFHMLPKCKSNGHALWATGWGWAALHIDIIISPRDDKLSNKTIAVKFTTHKGGRWKHKRVKTAKKHKRKRKVEGEREEEKGNTYSMAKNWAVSIFMGQARSNFNISINFWQFFCKLPATVRQTESVREGEGKETENVGTPFQ